MACISTAKILGKIHVFYANCPPELIGVVPRLKVANLAAREIGCRSVLRGQNRPPAEVLAGLRLGLEREHKNLAEIFN